MRRIWGFRGNDKWKEEEKFMEGKVEIERKKRANLRDLDLISRGLIVTYRNILLLK